MEMMAPGGVYGHQISRPMFPFRSSEPQKPSLEENFSSNELGSCPKSNTDEKYKQDGRSRYSGGEDMGRRSHDDQGQRVKLPTFDGKPEWKPYFLQFNHIAGRYGWTNNQKLDRFVECLRDKALKYYSSRPISVQNNFVSLCQKM